jgi:hypothetical protein
MQYREGFGFVVDESEQQDMARLGIGRPPVVDKPMEYQPAEQVNQEQPMQYQPVQNEQTIRIPQKSDEEIRRESEDYMNKVLGRNAQPIVEQKIVTEVPKQSDDFFGSWFDEKPKEASIQREEQIVSSDTVDPIIDYRKAIVSAAVKLGKDPEEVERTIASITPEEYVILASIKADYERNAIKQNEQAKQPIVFNSIKPKPIPTVAIVPSAEFNTQKIDRSSVVGNAIRYRFY